jgi:hypothetical protein
MSSKIRFLTKLARLLENGFITKRSSLASYFSWKIVRLVNVVLVKSNGAKSTEMNLIFSFGGVVSTREY